MIINTKKRSRRTPYKNVLEENNLVSESPININVPY